MRKELTLTLDFEEELLTVLKREVPNLYDFRILSESLDARNACRGRRPKVTYKVEVVDQNDLFLVPEFSFSKVDLPLVPIIVGAGPAGLFTALRLDEYGIKTIIYERGDDIEKRMPKIAKFWKDGELDLESNVSYGAGGAGLFSDGKLFTRIKSPHVGYVLKKLHQFGAPKEVTYKSNPHLGSNKMRPIVANIISYLKEKGHIINFNARVDSLILNDRNVSGVILHDGKKVYSSAVFLATGHSGDDVYTFLHKQEVSLKAKDFAIGVRVEHPKEVIDRLQFGSFLGKKNLEYATYRLTYHDKKLDRGTYSFCMCPGGLVISSGTHRDGLVSNGMSNYLRNLRWSNAAIITTIKPQIDFDKNDLFAGLKFQRSIEQSAWNLSMKYEGFGKKLPAMPLKDFLLEKFNSAIKTPNSSCPSGVTSAPIYTLFAQKYLESLQKGFEEFNKNIPGFICSEALLIAPETRTSSAFTIVRDPETLQSQNTIGLYPVGEGAGLAGGITSAAVDGVKAAIALLNRHGVDR